MVTNFSNLSWIKIKDRSMVIPTHWDYNKTTSEYKFYDINTPLHNMYINILNTIKSLPPQIFNEANSQCPLDSMKITSLCNRNINATYKLVYNANDDTYFNQFVIFYI